MLLQVLNPSGFEFLESDVLSMEHESTHVTTKRGKECAMASL